MSQCFRWVFFIAKEKLQVTMNKDDLYTFLNTAIAYGGVQWLEAVAKCATENSELEIKAPCIAALPAWGKDGLQKMVDLALKYQTSKNISATLKSLAAIAAGRKITSHLAFTIDEVFADKLNKRIQALTLSNSARVQLASLFAGLPTEELLIPLGVAFSQIAIADTDISSEIVSAMSSRWLKFGPHELDQFEVLLRDRPSDEPALHSFLEKNPQILDPSAIQVWSKPDFHGAREPDFLIRRSDDTYLVIEIENAKKRIQTQADQLTAAATQAIKQANDYRGFLAARITEAKHHFPYIDEPTALVVIGLERSLSTSQREALARENASRHKLSIVGFDVLLERARTVLRNVTTSQIEVIKRYRVV